MSEQCNHYWSCDHTVYSTTKENVNKIHRWCESCQVHQWAYTGRWRVGDPPNLTVLEMRLLKEKRQQIKESPHD